jgi:hypothetical protein
MGSEIVRLLEWDTLADAAAREARVRLHPAYPRAVRRFAADTLAAGDADRLLDGLLKDSGRNAAALCAAYLHYSGGLTLPRLKELLGRFGVASPGRARALLIYLGYLGYVELLGAPRRGAAALYRPTPRFLATWREHQQVVLNAVQLVEPALGALLARFDAPGVFETFARLECEGFVAAAGDYDMDAPYFRVFMHHLGGIQVSHALIAQAPGESFPPDGPIPFSVTGAARRFRVSRPQVRRILDAAAREGLLTLDADAAASFTPAGREAVDGFLAKQIAVLLAAAAGTVKALPHLAETPTLKAG